MRDQELAALKTSMSGLQQELSTCRADAEHSLQVCLLWRISAPVHTCTSIHVDQFTKGYMWKHAVHEDNNHTLAFFSARDGPSLPQELKSRLARTVNEHVGVLKQAQDICKSAEDRADASERKADMAEVRAATYESELKQAKADLKRSVFAYFPSPCTIYTCFIYLWCFHVCIVFRDTVHACPHTQAGKGAQAFAR